MEAGSGYRCTYSWVVKMRLKRLILTEEQQATACCSVGVACRLMRGTRRTGCHKGEKGT